MKPRTTIAVAVVALALLAGAYALLGAADSDAARGDGGTALRHSDRTATAASLSPEGSPAHSPAAHSRVEAAAALPGSRRDERSSAATPTGVAPPAAVAADAAQSLAQSLQHGDDRSPPIARDSVTAELPTAAELADPAAYRRYENRQQSKLYRAYQTEATIALGDMQRDIARARAQGLPPELIAEGEEKQRRLEQTLRALENGELQ